MTTERAEEVRKVLKRQGYEVQDWTVYDRQGGLPYPGPRQLNGRYEGDAEESLLFAFKKAPVETVKVSVTLGPSEQLPVEQVYKVFQVVIFFNHQAARSLMQYAPREVEEHVWRATGGFFIVSEALDQPGCLRKDVRYLHRRSLPSSMKSSVNVADTIAKVESSQAERFTEWAEKPNPANPFWCWGLKASSAAYSLCEAVREMVF